MNLLVIYLLLLLIMIGISLITIFAFLRYRFTGDMTYVIVLGFIISFAIVVTLTLSFLDYSALSFDSSGLTLP